MSSTAATAPAGPRGRRARLPVAAVGREGRGRRSCWSSRSCCRSSSTRAARSSTTASLALAYTVMALGLNIIVGFAGLLDLGYVAFFAIGAYTHRLVRLGLLRVRQPREGHPRRRHRVHQRLPGIHLNFLLVLVAAVLFTTIAGILIGLPTLRLRGDYIAIVTLAFGEIIGRIALNGDDISDPSSASAHVQRSTNAARQGITPIGQDRRCQGSTPFTTLDLRPWYWTRARARGDRAVRQLPRCATRGSAAPGSPCARTRSPRWHGRAVGQDEAAGLRHRRRVRRDRRRVPRLLHSNTVNADQFQFYFSILILGMVILGGLGSIWGMVLGAITLTFINFWLLPDVLNALPSKIGLDFDMTQITLRRSSASCW